MSVEVQHLQPIPRPGRVGQATVVEQSRAVAEVMAAVQVAQACPRDMDRARAEMRRSCSEYRMAESAFYRFPRGGKSVTGPTVALARELKRCFGNFQSGIAELRRDDEHGQSELQAWAWDVETNSRSATTVVVPHRNYMNGSALSELRDVYENNANQGARREREMILGLLPQWYVEEAIAACRATLERGDGTPLVQRQERAEKALGTLGISRERVERKVGRPMTQWTAEDLATLTIAYQSIRTGELRAEDEFPTPTVTVEDITGPPAPKPAPPAPQQPAASSTGATLDQRAWRAMQRRLNELEVIGRGQTERRYAVMAHILERPVAKPEDLTDADARLILDNLAGDNGLRVVAAALGADEPTPLVEHGGDVTHHDGPDLTDATATDEDDIRERSLAATVTDEELPDPTVGGDPWAGQPEEPPAWPEDQA